MMMIVSEVSSAVALICEAAGRWVPDKGERCMFGSWVDDGVPPPRVVKVFAPVAVPPSIVNIVVSPSPSVTMMVPVTVPVWSGRIRRGGDGHEWGLVLGEYRDVDGEGAGGAVAVVRR